MIRSDERERRVQAFIDAYGRTGNGTQAAKDAGYKGNSVRTYASRLLAQPEVRERAEAARAKFLAETEDTHKRQREALIRKADDAIEALGKVVQGKVGRGAVARVSAAIAILDRAGHKPTERVDHTSSDGTMTPKGLDADTLAARVRQVLQRAAAKSG